MSEASDLATVLGEAQRCGDIGKAPVAWACAHARGFFAAGHVTADESVDVVDLGSGGGVPALPLAIDWPLTRWSLVESRTGRATRLAEAVTALAVDDRVTVVRERAEIVGHGVLRGQAHVVTARSFAAPPVVAECAAPLLRPGGVLLVSEPPHGEDRWPETGLALVGLAAEVSWETDEGHFRAFRLVGEVPDQLPRRPGRPAKQPLF